MNHLELKKQIREYLKSGGFAWPGGYEIRPYFSDGETICYDCFKKELKQIIRESLFNWKCGWDLIGFDVHWEGPAEYCVQCNRELPSEYGDPDFETE